MNSEYGALGSFQIKVVTFLLARGGRCQREEKKSVDQRAPQIGYERIKSLWSLAMINYLVTGGLLSLVESYNDNKYSAFMKIGSLMRHRIRRYRQRLHKN